MRLGGPLKVGRETVSFGRNVLEQVGSDYKLQHRLFVNDPWELIAEAVHRKVRDLHARDSAHSFRRQAEDYFNTATVSGELAVRPVLLYYAFLNLSKAFAIAKGNASLARRAYHGVSAHPKPRSVSSSIIRFDNGRRPAVFQELLRHLTGNAASASSDLQLGYLLPQILPGHRLWCYATNRPERFVSVERFDLAHSETKKEVWLNIWVNKADLERLGLSERTTISRAGLLDDFEVVGDHRAEVAQFQQRVPASYSVTPAEALAVVIRMANKHIWETVKIVSPYRKSYIYCAPSKERTARMPQILSIYLLMFFLGSVTRYNPEYFESLFESKYGPFFETFISESPMQYLYLVASELLGREVSRPAII
jgi:YaaC-like Protein